MRSLRSAYEEAIYAEVVVFFVVVFFAGFFVVMVSEVVREGCRANSARDVAASRGFSDAFQPNDAVVHNIYFYSQQP